MRRVIVAMLSVIMLFSCYTLNASALVANQIFSDKIKAEKGDSVVIPVYIKNNTGLMGFRINVSYDENIFSNPSVKRGDLTTGGNFNDSIVSITKGRFDVVWNETSDVSSDGVLFYVYLTVNGTAKTGDYDIALSYKQADTFNEKWQDVKLNCSDIHVEINGINPAEPETEKQTVWQKIVSFFKSIYNFIIGLFN